MTDPSESPEVSVPDVDGEDPGWPMSFILLVIAGGLYLVLRIFQMARDLFA